MFLRAFLRTALWTILVLVVALVGIYLAIDLGIIDWAFGIPAEHWLEGIKAAFQLKYGVHGDTIDRGIKIAGFGFTVVLGLLGFLSWWIDTEMNLPERLQKYINAIRDKQLVDRAVALAPYASRNLRGDVEPLPKPDLLQRLKSLIRPDRASKLAGNALERALIWNREIQVLGAKLTASRGDRITAHLIAALRLVEEARDLPLGTSDQSTKYAAAMAELTSALTLDPNDMDALELAARVAKLQNSKETMQKTLDTLERVTLNHPLRHSRALRFQAEVLEERATKAALNNARVKLERALTHLALSHLDTVEGHAGEPFERAFVNEQLAALHLTRGTVTRVESYLNDAEAIFEQLPSQEGPAGIRRIKAYAKSWPRFSAEETSRRSLAKKRTNSGLVGMGCSGRAPSVELIHRLN